MSRSRLARVCGLLLALWTICGFVQSASAQKAALVTATRSSESAWWQYVKQKILATGLYTAVDQIDSAFSDPTLTQLQNYKLVVVLSSDYGLSSADGVGNALGDYMSMVPGAASASWETASRTPAVRAERERFICGPRAGSLR